MGLQAQLASFCRETRESLSFNGLVSLVSGWDRRSAGRRTLLCEKRVDARKSVAILQVGLAEDMSNLSPDELGPRAAFTDSVAGLWQGVEEDFGWEPARRM